MRIAILNWRDLENPEAGGAEAVAHRQTLGLQRLGHEVTWFTAGFPGASPYSDHLGYPVHRIGNKFTVYGQAARKLHRQRPGQEFDALVEHVNGVPWFTPLWSRLPTVTYLYHVIGRTFFQELPWPAANVGYGIERAGPWVYHSARMACLGPSSREDFVHIGYPRDRICPLPPGIDPTPDSGKRERFVVPTFVMLGRLKLYKRHDLALRAMAEVRKVIPDARLVIAGRDPGDLRPRLRRMAEDLGVHQNVDDQGIIDHETKVSLLTRAWALVVPSDQEGWGLGITEAGSCGTAAIGSDVGGIRDAIRPDETGFLFHPGSARHLAEKMVRIALDPSLRDQVGEAARAYANRFDWRRHVEALEEMIRLAILGRPYRFPSWNPLRDLPTAFVPTA